MNLHIPHQDKKNMVPDLLTLCECTQLSIIKSDRSITYPLQAFSVHYSVLQARNNMRSASAINPVTTQKTDDSCYKHITFYHKLKSCTVGKKKVFLLTTLL